MGAWGTGILDDDIALDFLMSLSLFPVWPRVRRPLRSVIRKGLEFDGSEEAYVDAGEATEALAAAEVVAFRLGRDSPLGGWLNATLYLLPPPSRRTLELAAQAVSRVLVHSELSEDGMWRDEATRSEWFAQVNDLKKRLES